MKTKLIGYFSIGYPTDNPYLDNKYIGNTLRCAQQNLNNNDAVFDAVDRLLSLRDNLPVILLAYDESIRTANVENFMARARKTVFLTSFWLAKRTSPRKKY